MSIHDAVGHIKWSIENSPKAYAECREFLIDLRIMLVNAELLFQRNNEKENVNDNN